MLAKSANMQYTRVTVDAEAAIKFYQAIWNNENEFKKVLIHLRDLQRFMEFFGMAGKLAIDRHYISGRVICNW